MDSGRLLKDLGELLGVITAIIAVVSAITFAAFNAASIVVQGAYRTPASAPQGLDSSGPIVAPSESRETQEVRP